MIGYFELIKNFLHMKKTLIIYSTTDGQTKRICDRIIEFSKNKSEITLCEIENAPSIDLDHYRKICLSQCKKLTQDFSSLISTEKN